MPLNQNLQKLFAIAQKPEKTAIGLMSGTSLDGLDIALCSIKGNGLRTTVKLLDFATIPYQRDFKKEIQEIFACKDGGLEKACLLNAFTGKLHGGLVLQALAGWKLKPAAIDFVASHGQTVYHAPARLHQQRRYSNATLQIGDGDHIAVKTGIITISDFRQKHIAAGGEGAPLALYGDVLLAGKPGENRILLNLGGIANLTFLPAGGGYTGILSTDTGPGNTLIDAACRKYFNKDYDEGSAIALSGNTNGPLLNALLSHPFFKEQAPKTTGPELFNLDEVAYAQQISGTADISSEDIIATLSTFTARSVSDFIKANFKERGIHIFVSGGGAKNMFIMDSLKRLLPEMTVADTGSIGIDPDAKEAILFAVLGNEALCGEPMIIGNNPAVLMGKFSFPL